MASICFAGTANLWALDQTEGVYQIGTAQDLVDFAALVNGGEYTANAVLTADIDMSSVENFTPIGTYTSNGEQLYKGTFDGQGHKISHLTIDWPGANAIGLFNTGDNVHLLDFWLDDQCVISGNENVGLVGRHQGIGASFERIGNAGNVNGTAANAGGLFGVAVASSGGAVVNACWTSGNIVSVGRGAAFVGWFASGGSAFTFTNCWTVADVSNPTSDGTYVARYGTAPTFRNCWSLHGTQVGRVGSIELFHSGRVCWYINNQAGMNVWYQTLGEDDLPLPDETHGVVVKNDDGTYGNATGVEAVRLSSESAVYDLSGRRIDGTKLPKGVYIVNGKKILK